MEEELQIKWKIVGLFVMVIIVFYIGFYFGGATPKKNLNELEGLFSQCQNYCSALNETGYLRFEPSDTHYKCFCYSDNLKRMEAE